MKNYNKFSFLETTDLSNGEKPVGNRNLEDMITIGVSDKTMKWINGKQPELKGSYNFVNLEDVGNFSLSSIKGVVLGTEKFGRKEISMLPNLKVISRIGTGFDNIRLNLKKCDDISIGSYVGDLYVDQESGAYVTLAWENTSKSVASYDIGQLYRIAENFRTSDDGDFGYNNVSKDVRELKIGVVGLGNIGSELIRQLLAIGFEPGSIHAFDINNEKTNCFAEELKISGYEPIIISNSYSELINSSDVVFVHIPSNETNYKILSTGFFSMFGDDDNKTLISVVRPEVIDWNAVESWSHNRYMNTIGIFDCNHPIGHEFNCSIEFTNHTSTRNNFFFSRMVEEAVDNVRRILVDVN